MRRTFSIISHILIAIVAVMTAVYNVYRFVDGISHADGSFLGVLSLVLFAAYTAALFHMEFEMFLNAGAFAYGVGRVNPSRTVMNVVILAIELFFLFPVVASVAYFIFTGEAIAFGRWLPYALLGDFVIYVFLRWLKFLSGVSEKGR